MAKHATTTDATATKANPATNPEIIESTALATQEPAQNNAGTAMTDVTEFDSLIGETAGQGFEHVTSDDLIIPRITILQKLSPQLDKKKAAYIEGASVGDLCDTSVREVFSEIQVLPVAYFREFLEWAPRDTQQGIVGRHDESIMRQTTLGGPRGKTPTLPNGNSINETATFTVLNLTAGGRKSFISFAVSALRIGKMWITQAQGERALIGGRMIMPPLFYRTYTVKTASISRGNDDWETFVVERGPSVREIENGAYWLKEAITFAAALREKDYRYEELKPGEDFIDADGVVHPKPTNDKAGANAGAGASDPYGEGRM